MKPQSDLSCCQFAEWGRVRTPKFDRVFDRVRSRSNQATNCCYQFCFALLFNKKMFEIIYQKKNTNFQTLYTLHVEEHSTLSPD